MADDTDALGPLLADLAKYGVGTAGTLGANAATQSAYQAIIKNLQDRFSDYKNLAPANYHDITPQQLGPSALTGIQPDAQARLDEQNAIGQLDDIAKSGGLTLADKAALNKIESTLNRNASARNNSLANQFAARGQLGSGAQLAMGLANNQNAAENANERGEGIAGQAQQRAMQAVLSKAGASRNMSNDDYARKKAAAEATDAISKYNASMTTDAAKSNNAIAGQAYDDSIKRLYGQTGLTNSLNGALLGQGQGNANTIAGAAYGGTGLISSLANAGKNLSKLATSGSGGGGSSTDSTNPDQTGNRGGAGDLTGGHTDTEDPTNQDVSQPTASDPSEWEPGF